MSILRAATNRLRRRWAPVIGRCASGANAGGPPTRWPTPPVQGRRGVFPPEVRAQVTATACSLPRATGTPVSRWSRAEVAQYLAQDPTLPPISSSTVGRWLKADRIRPWRYHAWQHIHDPVAFLQRARPVLEAYAQARALLQTGIWLVSLDEKTSDHFFNEWLVQCSQDPIVPFAVGERCRSFDANNLQRNPLP